MSASTPIVEPLVQGVRLRLRRRLAWLAFRADVIQEPPDSLAHVLHAGDEFGAEAAWRASQPELAALNLAIVDADHALHADGSRWSELCEVLQLTPFCADVLQVAVAVAVEPPLRRAFAALDGWKGRDLPSIPQVARLFSDGPRVLAADAPVLRWDLVRGGGSDDSAGLLADPAIVAWLAGAPLMDTELLGVGAEVQAHRPLPGWPVDDAREALCGSAPPVRLRIVGPAGAGRRTFAAVVAAALGVPLLAVAGARDDSALDRTRWRRACRRARLCHELLAWVGPPPLCEDASLAPDRLFLVLTPQDSVAPLVNRIDPVIDLPLPDVITRRALWEEAVPGATAWPAGELDQLAATHRVTVAELRAVAALGVEDAKSASAAVRAAGRGVLGGLAQRLACTFALDDLVAPPIVRSAIEDLLFEARERLVVWDDPALRRLFPLGTGLLALFCGPPGTGKTMAAQVIARELDLDLYRIDLASVVSKYVGETARNLDRVLAHAARMDVVLFFDEADALFGKRTDIRDAHDRYANTDTNYLLQAVEGYPGIALLATNRKGNIDGAFLRRLRHVLEFPAPDSGLRLRLWEALVAAIGGEDARALTVAALPTFAAAFDESGAQI